MGIAAERRRAEARVCLDTGEGVVAVTRIVWVLLFQRWKAELSGDPLLRATVHGQWGVFFEGQQDEESGEGHPTAIVKVVTAGLCALIWLVGLRVFEQTTLFFFSQANTTASRRRTRHRNCPSPHHLHSRDCSSCRERLSRLGLPSSPSLVNSQLVAWGAWWEAGKTAQTAQ